MRSPRKPNTKPASRSPAHAPATSPPLCAAVSSRCAGTNINVCARPDSLLQRLYLAHLFGGMEQTDVQCNGHLGSNGSGS